MSQTNAELRPVTSENPRTWRIMGARGQVRPTVHVWAICYIAVRR